MKTAREGDRIWFLGNKQLDGKIIAVATFTRWNHREIGPLVAVTRTNEELGWTEQEGDWDVEVHYENLYDLRECELIPGIRGQTSVRRYDATKCLVNLPQEYKSIVKYCKARKI